MTHYLISFPSSAMSHVSDQDLPSVGESARAVIRDAKAAGVYVFGGGIDETVPPVRVGLSTSATVRLKSPAPVSVYPSILM